MTEATKVVSYVIVGASENEIQATKVVSYVILDYTQNKSTNMLLVF